MSKALAHSLSGRKACAGEKGKDKRQPGELQAEMIPIPTKSVFSLVKVNTV